jgi:hypothetical protein
MQFSSSSMMARLARGSTASPQQQLQLVMVQMAAPVNVKALRPQ